MSFKTTKSIILQPHDDGLVYSFKFPVTTSPTTNDGFLPPGTTISGVEIMAYNSNNTTTSGWYNLQSHTTDTVNVAMSYPGTADNYKLTFVITLSSGATIEADFHNIKAVDK